MRSLTPKQAIKRYWDDLDQYGEITQQETHETCLKAGLIEPVGSGQPSKVYRISGLGWMTLGFVVTPCGTVTLPRRAPHEDV